MSKKILILAGDGIGKEICQQALKVLEFFNKNHQFSFDEADIGGVAIDNYKNPYPSQTSTKAKAADAILLGAVGGPKWDNLGMNERPEKGLLGIRKELELFANFRPAKIFNELVDASSLKKEVIAGLDILILRELTGDVYFGEPKGIENLPNGEKKAYNTMVYSTHEIERIAKVAFETARKRGKKLCSIDKANVLITSKYWREVVETVHKNYADVELSHMYVDNAAMQLVRNPKQFDVILTGNIFGDILSDIAAQLTGSLGMLPSASIGNNNDKCSHLYEPIHGSAPDIAGKNLANPIATILSVAMMFEYSFNMKKQALMIEDAISSVLKQGFRTADIKNSATSKDKILGTKEMGEKILGELRVL